VTGSDPTTARTFLLPDLGEGLAEAEVVQWHVAEGDEVKVDQVVVTVETAKATVDLPCPYAGHVRTLYGRVGAVLEVGKPLLTIGADEKTSSGNVLIGYGTSETRRSHRRRVTLGGSTSPTIATPTVAASPRRTDRSGAPQTPVIPRTPVTITPRTPVTITPRTPATVTPRPQGTSRTMAPKVISPVVRKLAKDNGVDLSGLAPTGAGGVIRRADVEAVCPPGNAIRPTDAEAPRPPGHTIRPTDPEAQRPPGNPIRPSDSEARLGDSTAAPGAGRAYRAVDIRIPLRGVRKVIADKLTTSRREIPEVTTWVDVDATALMAARDEIKTVNADAGIGLMALFARISVAGLRRFPELNARVDVEAQEIVQLGDINLSFAAQSPRGLMVPVVHGAQVMTTAELAAAIRELTALARDGQLAPAQMTGGTFTLNNYGVFGVDGSTPIINFPEAAMLGIGRVIDRPWAHGGQLALRKVAQLSFTFDHRVCDGATAGGFLRFVADCVESPSSLLAHL
jgi:2-oxoisovalerate dehydrogenase E2 component (dihydrolipoyl transacylase)